jgi:hypothetical protein
LIEVAGVFHEQQAPFGSQTFRLVDKIEGTEAFIGGAEGCILRRHVYLGDYRDFGYLPTPSLIIEPTKNPYMIRISSQAFCGGKDFEYRG